MKKNKDKIIDKELEEESFDAEIDHFHDDFDEEEGPSHTGDEDPFS